MGSGVRLLSAQKRLKATERKEVEAAVENLLYSSGSVPSDIEMEDGSSLSKVHVCANMTCNSQIEFAFYSAGYERICIHCGQKMVYWRKWASTPNAMFVMQSSRGSKGGARRHINR